MHPIARSLLGPVAGIVGVVVAVAVIALAN
jgi:hypothetical protein